jgi:copper homeostasis protein
LTTHEWSGSDFAILQDCFSSIVAPMRIEICVDSIEGALAAQRGGADRVELCSSLEQGGTTPAAGLIQVARQNLTIGIYVMVRPRAGDFLYTDREFEVMLEEIRVAKRLRCEGVVFGCLTLDGRIHVEQMRVLRAEARPLQVTCHRAFDMCRDPKASLELLTELQFDRILTSGQQQTCIEGRETIANLQKQARGRIIIMAGGGIRPENVREIVEATGVREVHLSARGLAESGMAYRNPLCRMGSDSSEFTWKTTNESVVRAVVAAVR